MMRKHSELCALFQAQTHQPVLQHQQPHQLQQRSSSSNNSKPSGAVHHHHHHHHRIECTFGTENTLRGVKIYTKVKCLPANRRSMLSHVLLGWPQFFHEFQAWKCVANNLRISGWFIFFFVSFIRLLAISRYSDTLLIISWLFNRERERDIDLTKISKNVFNIYVYMCALFQIHNLLTFNQICENIACIYFHCWSSRMP